MINHCDLQHFKVFIPCAGDPALFAEWCTELAGMANRIKDMRRALVQALKQAGVPGDWSFIERQIGMFSYTNLTKSQVND